MASSYQHALDLQMEIRREFSLNGGDIYQMRRDWEDFAAGQKGIKARLSNNGGAALANRSDYDRYLAHCEIFYHFAA